MTDNVAAFPDRSTRVWRVAADSLRERYRSLGYDDDLIEETVANIRPIFLECRDFSSQPEQSPDQIMEALQEWVSHFTSRLLRECADRELLLREIRREFGGAPAVR